MLLLWLLSTPMKNLILLIFTQADVESIPQAVTRLRTMGIERLWIVHNPHLGLPYPASAKTLDDEIALCERDKALSIARENFDDAAKHRNAANGLRVKRDLEIKNGYKALTVEQLQRVYTETFAAISQESTGIPNILMEATPDPLSPDQVFQYLHSQTAQWVDQFPHGEYAIAWIRAVAEEADGTVAQRIGSIMEWKNEKAQESDESRLQRTRFFTLRKMAIDEGIDAAGKTKPEIIAAILAARQPALA